jgi:hypothetical protein
LLVYRRIAAVNPQRDIKKEDILATSDAQAVQHAADSPDCPICDVLRGGEKVGSIL